MENHQRLPLRLWHQDQAAGKHFDNLMITVTFPSPLPDVRVK